jgi:hypothetical protein
VAVEAKRLSPADAVVIGKTRSGLSTLTLLAMALLLSLSAGALTGVLASYYLNN